MAHGRFPRPAGPALRRAPCILTAAGTVCALTLTAACILAADAPRPSGGSWAPLAESAQPIIHRQKDTGYRGIWYALPERYEAGTKYSGGLATYTAKHVPTAVYAPAARRTFFVYGGAGGPDGRQLQAIVGCYDHAAGRVSRPTIVHVKRGVTDPHDNASLAIDSRGHVWIFVAARGTARPGFVYRSTQPYGIDAFEMTCDPKGLAICYPQPWWVEGEGFLLLYTRYHKWAGDAPAERGYALTKPGGGTARTLYWRTSPDGRQWGDEGRLTAMSGQYQVSRCRGRRLGTAFNVHPGGQCNLRTNLYYLQTDDMGRSWHTVDGSAVVLPLTDIHNAALVHDFQAEGLRVYLKDLALDADGRPVVLVVTSRDHRPGPPGAPRTWTVVHWTGEAWQRHAVTTSTHNYDMGSLYVEADGTWRIIGPTDPGPQPLGAGGEMVMWTSTDRGQTWRRAAALTRSSPRNHTYARRPVDAQPDFYAFWCDGNPDARSECVLHFATRDGKVFALPTEMTGDWAEPKRCR